MLYEFTKLRLEKDEFLNLVFMNAPPWWSDEYHRERRHRAPELTMGQVFLRGLCCKPLKEVVQAVKEKAVEEKPELKGQCITPLLSSSN